jgi:hypothetical protein
MPLDYQNMSTDNLMELLAIETEKLTKFLAEKNFNKVYEECKEGIKQIQVIIDVRKGTTSTPNPVFEQPSQSLNMEIPNDPAPDQLDK